MCRQPNPVSRPRRRFLRFSVRGLIVLVLVIGAWLGWMVRSARIQREAVAAIENAGGEVLYDREWTDAGLVHLSKLPSLSELYIDDAQITDAGVKELQQALPRLTIER